MPGFTTIFGTRFDAAPVGDGPAGWFLTYRDRMCAHVTIEAGRCAAGRGEVMIGPATAKELGLGVGSAVPISQIEWIPVDGDRVPRRVGEPVVLSVVGVYRPTAPADPYWGPDPAVHRRPTLLPAVMEPLFAARDTARLFDLEINEDQAYDLVARKDALTAEWTAQHPAELARITTAAAEARGKVTAGTPPLIDRIEDSRAAVRSLVPWLVLPLVALCWYVVLLAAASGAEARRTELGQLALRGVPAGQRYWFAAAPDALAVLAGAPFGAIAGRLVGPLAAPDGASGLAAPGMLRNTLLAAAGGVVAVLLAYRSALTTRPVDLLRRVSVGDGRWRTAAAEVVVVALAAFALFEARATGTANRGGVTLLAPVLLVVFGALLVGRALPFVARGLGRRALRRGRLPAALAGIELARRPAARRALTLAVLGVALVCFGATAVDLGEQARASRAAVELGAERVLEVESIAGPALRTAVRAADPEGRWAMAAVRINPPGSAPVLAVDADRLAAVARPRVDPAIAARLRPPVAPSIWVDGARLEVDATAGGGLDDDAPNLYAVLRYGEERRLDLGQIRPGRRTYAVDFSSCTQPCRLIGLEVEDSLDQFTLTVHEIRQGAPDRPLADAAALADPAGWRAAATGDPTAVRPGLSVGADGAALQFRVSARGQRLLVADTPDTLPALTTPATPPTTQQLWSVAAPSGDRALAGSVASLPALPGAGAAGLVVDVEYLDRVVPMTAGGQPQVWLSAAAPPDAADRLAAAGIRVVSESRATDAVALADRHGVALAGRASYFAAGFALLLALLGLGLVAGVERRDRADQAAVLRAQGVRGSVLAAAGRRRQLWPLAAALVLGPAGRGRRLGAGPDRRADLPGHRLAGAAPGGRRPRGAARPLVGRGGRASGRSGVHTRRHTIGREGSLAMTGLAVACRRVVHIYRAEGGDVVALSGVDLSIGPGEMLALVGPSGSGKSTLVALLAGLMRPSAGRVNVGTFDLGKLTDAEVSRLRGTQIGVVLQGAGRNLLPYASIERNVWLAQRRAAGTAGIALDDPERILDLVGLAGRGGARLPELAPGARQRAALAVGVAASPGLLLVDEPTSQLDSRGRDEVLAAIETVNAERGTTVVVVTHDGDVGARLGRAVTIRDGRVGAEGRGGQDFAVVAGDGTVQLPPDVLGAFPPGTLFTVDQENGTVTLVPGGMGGTGDSAGIVGS